MFLKQSTSVDVAIGPFLDATDGITPETSLTITQPDVRLKKNSTSWAQKAASQTLSHEEAGWYEVTLDATDTNTIGILVVSVQESGALPVWMTYHVLAANVYDSLFGAATDKLDVNVEEWNTTAVPAEHTAGYPIVTIKDGTGTGELDTSSGAIAAVATTVATAIRSLVNGTSDSGTTTTMVDSARTEADTDYWKGAMIVFTSGNISGQTRYITAFTPASDTITFSPAVTQAVSTQTYEIWPTVDFLRPTVSGRTLDISATGEAGVDWANVGSPTTTLGLLGTTVGAVGTGGITTASFAAGAINSAAIGVDAIGASELAADAVAEIADAVWDEVIAGHLTGGTTGASLNGAASAGDPWVTAIPGAYSAGSAGHRLGNIPDVTAGAAGGVFIAGTNAATTITTALTTNLSGSVASIAANGISASSLAADAGAEIADAVWDEALAGHVTAGSAGAGLSSASSAGDPWATAIPGAYSSGTAGHRLGNVPDVAAGAAGGLLQAGTNAETTFTTALHANLIGNVTGDVSGSVGSIGANGITASSLASDAVTEIVTALLTTSGTIETGLSLKGAMQLCASILVGLASGFPDGSKVFSSADITANAVVGSTSRVTATTDDSGNRSSIVVDLS